MVQPAGAVTRDLSMAGAKYGAAVERGTHWMYSGAEPGVGSIQDEVEDIRS